MKKLSKVHMRLLGLTTSSTRLATGIKVVATHKSNNLKTKPEEKHIVWMPGSRAANYPVDGYAVISIGDVDRKEHSYPEFAAPTLYLNYSPYRGDGADIRRISANIGDFIKEHTDKNLLVHCSYGELRSPGLALGLFSATSFIKNAEDFHWQGVYEYLKDGTWITRCHRDPEKVVNEYMGYCNKSYHLGHRAVHQLNRRE